jgi:signal transduction histidine kinase
MRRRRQRIADLEDRAAALERERGLEADRAVGLERARIARELHDIVAHALSIMVVQSGAARRVLATQPALATEALVNVEATGREALVEMRRLLGVLRSEGDTTQLAPQPSLHRLDELVASSELLVSLSVEGDPQPISPAVELSAYRIVQEALTNVRKHAGPATTEVHVQYRPDVIVLAVLDDGRGASAALHAAAATTGHGLMGMRERVSLCGGQLRVGPRPGGGWSVHAELPYATPS